MKRNIFCVAVIVTCVIGMEVRGENETEAGRNGVEAKAGGGYVISGQCGNGCSWSLYTSSGLLNVKGTYMMGMGWKQYKDYIKSVTISDGMTFVADFAFEGCKNIVGVKLGRSIRTIGTHAFEGCKRLTSINIPNSVNSIGNYAFKDCGALQVIDVNCANNIGDSGMCVSCSRVFKGCKSLKWISVAEGNSVYSSYDGIMYDRKEEVLLYCPEGKEYGYYYPDSIKTIEYEAFKDCKSIKWVVIPETVSKIESSAFSGCSKLSEVCYLGESDAGRSSSGVFSGCESLRKVYVSDKYKDKEFCGKDIEKGGLCGGGRSSSSSGGRMSSSSSESKSSSSGKSSKSKSYSSSTITSNGIKKSLNEMMIIIMGIIIITMTL